MTAVHDSKSLLAEVIRQEKRIELARMSLAGFVKLRFHMEGRQLDWNWHHEYLCELLEGVTNFESSVRFLLIAIWPGSLKSELVAQSWQPWMIGRDESWWSSLVSASNSAGLASRDSKKSMEIIQSPWFEAVFPQFGVDRRTGKAAKWKQERIDDWITPNGSFRITTGVESNTTGKGAGRLLWDDILAAKDGMSEAVRTKTNEWVGETWRSRLRDQIKGTSTGIMQRLHEKDPIGQLLEERKKKDATPYNLIEIPLESQRPKMYAYGGFRHLRRAGDIAHPERFTPEVIGQLKTSMRANYDGQYNQAPSKLEGRMLKPHRFIVFDRPAEQIVRELNLRIVIYGDLAAKEKELEKDDPDWSAWGVMARDGLQRKWLLDLWRDRTGMDGAAASLLDLLKKWKKVTGYEPQVKVEKGVLEHSFKSVLRSVCKTRKRAGVAIVGLSIVGDKIMRAGPFQSCVDSNQFCIVQGLANRADYESECRAFPRGGHDDMVDLTGLGIEDLENIPAGEMIPTPADIDPTKITGDMLRAKEQAKKVILERWNPGKP